MKHTDMNVGLSSLHPNPHNPREQDRLAANAARLSAVIEREGWLPESRIVVSEQKNGDYKILKGNSRYLALQELKIRNPNLFNALFPSGKIPAVVYTGLTEREEILLAEDHTPDYDRMPLNEYEQIEAVRNLLQIIPPLSQEEIAVNRGWVYQKDTRSHKKGEANRSYTQQRVNIARLPSFVRDEYRKLAHDKDSTNVRMEHHAELFKVFNAESVQYPNGDGPEFTKLWQSIVNPPTIEESTPANEPSELSPKSALTISQSAGSKTLKLLLLVLTGQNQTVTFGQIDAAVAKMEGETGFDPASLTEPKATEPKATEPKATEPKATEPKATDSYVPRQERKAAGKGKH